MSRRKTSFEDAIKIYTSYTGDIPTEQEIEYYWHRYANNWKPYDGFEDYLKYALA